jgi:CaM kinase-like vesicle-associated protein
MVGTPNYTAPDIISGSMYGRACDVWSVGIIMYLLLSGNFPFSDENI